MPRGCVSKSVSYKVNWILHSPVQHQRLSMIYYTHRVKTAQERQQRLQDMSEMLERLQQSNEDLTNQLNKARDLNKY